MNEINELILKHFKDGSRGIKCGFCNGEGSFPETVYSEGPSHEPCPVCNGKGINKYVEEPSELILCGLCKGDGKDSDEGYFFGDTCKACDGKGVLKFEDRNENKTDFWTLLHPRIVDVAKSRFQAKHYADSVEAAFKEINKVGKDILRKKTSQEKDGVNIFETLFSLSSPIIKLGNLKTESGRNIQQGYLQIFCGSIKGIRNPKAHANISIEKNNAIHLLFLASLLMGKLKST